VAFQDFRIIHAVKLVACENQLVIIVASCEPVQMLAYRVGRALEPVRICDRLFGCEDFDVSFSEWIEAEAVRDVTIQGGGIKLRQDHNLPQPGIEAIADRDINEPILAAKGNSGFRTILCQWEKTLPGAAGEND
jgi:hypothetical protein